MVNWKILTSQTGQQIIAIPTLPNISRSKDNLTTKLDDLIEHNMINYFFEKSYTKCDGKATLRPFYKVTKFSISLDHQSEIFWSLFFLYVQVVIYQLITIIITILITMKIKVLITWSRICRDEISTRPAGTDFTLRLHRGIKLSPGKTGQFSTWYLHKCVYIFF